MREIRHALSGAVYGLDGEGLVRVERNGKVGWFDWEGRWVRGDVLDVVPHLCLWIAGPQLPPVVAEVRRAVVAEAQAKSAAGGQTKFA